MVETAGGGHEAVKVDLLDPHPDNPRLRPREDVVAAIEAAVRERGFDPAHALIVRPVGERFQVVSGHHRRLAAQRAGLAEVPAWVRPMSDLDAMMALVLDNAQGELSPLERALHAEATTYDARTSDKPEGKMAVSDYAEKVRLSQGKISLDVRGAKAWRAYYYSPNNRPENDSEPPNLTVLIEISAASAWLWTAMVEAAIGRGWTAESAKRRARALKSLPTLPRWADAARVAESLVDDLSVSSMSPGDVELMAGLEAGAAVTDPDLRRMMVEQLYERRPGSLAEARAIVAEAEARQGARGRDGAGGSGSLFGGAPDAGEDADEDEGGAGEAGDETPGAPPGPRGPRLDVLRDNCSLAQWKDLTPRQRAELLRHEGEDAPKRTFNPQGNTAIEWAAWSWNPVTGCEHGCVYCYARVIAKQPKMANAYPHGFEPAFRPRSVFAPRSMKVPARAEGDVRHKNVFVCSMADLFGRWVPDEWIEAVLREVRAAPDWNFLFLTKFPKRMAEFDLPPNGWYGTTVDLKDRVRVAEAAFAKIKARRPGTVTWLSCEPMLDPLGSHFTRLDLFDWVVIGGSSEQPATDETPATPAWRPPFGWIVELYRAAHKAKCKVYFKTNLLGARVLEAPAGMPVPQEPAEPPAVFRYLGKTRGSAETLEAAPARPNGGVAKHDAIVAATLPDPAAGGLTAGQRAARALLDGGTKEAAEAHGASWPTVKQAAQVRKADAALFARVVDGSVSPSYALKTLARERDGEEAGP